MIRCKTIGELKKYFDDRGKDKLNHLVLDLTIQDLVPFFELSRKLPSAATD
jgi:hypothetical protein